MFSFKRNNAKTEFSANKGLTAIYVFFKSLPSIEGETIRFVAAN